LFIASAAMMTATLRVNLLFERLKREINAKADPHDRIPLFGWSYHNWGALGKHKRLYVQSNVRDQYYRWIIATFALWLVMMFCLFSLVRSFNR
jgi:hypothetical protein